MIRDAHIESPTQTRILTSFSERDIEQMADVLIDCVEGGASVSFVLPMTREKAVAFWRGAASSAMRGERLVIVAEDNTGAIVGTVQVHLALPENQPHRGEISKLLVHRCARRRGLGTALLEAAERAALSAGKTLLVLDTAGREAARLYVRQGWRTCGSIPDYALWPDGTRCSTTFFYKQLREGAGVDP